MTYYNYRVENLMCDNKIVIELFKIDFPDQCHHKYIF